MAWCSDKAEEQFYILPLVFLYLHMTFDCNHHKESAEWFMHILQKEMR